MGTAPALSGPPMMLDRPPMMLSKVKERSSELAERLRASLSGMFKEQTMNRVRGSFVFLSGKMSQHAAKPRGTLR